MDGIDDLLQWSENNDVNLEFFPDPEYDAFDNNLYEKKEDQLLTIQVKLLLVLISVIAFDCQSVLTF